MKAINLKTEYLKNPIGIDIENPRLMWNCDGGITQTAFQINAFDIDGNLIFDSGKIPSNSMQFTYPLNLLSRARIYWQVKLWDENDKSEDFSEKAFFEIGLKRKADFKGVYVTNVTTSQSNQKATRKSFLVTFE